MKSEDEYPVKRIKWNELDLEIENPAGTIRSGVSKNGHKWQVKMIDHYGRIPHTVGLDGDMVDVYLKAREPRFNRVFKIYTKNPETGEFDESKWMLGYRNSADAQTSFYAHYDQPDFFGYIEEVPFADFKRRSFNSTINEMKTFKQIIEYISINAKNPEIGYDKEKDVFYAEVSSMNFPGNKMPMEIELYNPNTKGKRRFRFEKPKMDAENEIMHWVYKSKEGSTFILFND